MLGDQKNTFKKKLYYLTEAGISFVPILWKLAAWTQEFRNPSQDIVETVNRYSSDTATMDDFINTLRKIHIEKTIQPEPNCGFKLKLVRE